MGPSPILRRICYLRALAKAENMCLMSDWQDVCRGHHPKKIATFEIQGSWGPDLEQIHDKDMLSVGNN